MQGGTVDAVLIELACLDAVQVFTSVLRDRAPVPIDCANVNVKTRDVVATLDNFVIDTDDTGFSAGGEIDFAGERVDITLHATPEDISVGIGYCTVILLVLVPMNGCQRSGRCRAGGKSNRGEIVFAHASAVSALPVAALPILLDRKAETRCGDYRNSESSYWLKGDDSWPARPSLLTMRVPAASSSALISNYCSAKLA
ncbi:MAG: hypothetical protein ABR612_14245 [Chromatocurvus sp.]